LMYPHHWIRDVLNSTQIQIEKVHIDDNEANMLTKVMTREKLEVCRQLAGMSVRMQ
jgi:bifunctional DNase/RNase